jgi:ribosome maturation protein Sdo1
MFNKEEQTEIVVSIIEENRELPIKKIRAHIELAEGVTLTGKEVSEILKAEGISTARIGFVDSFYAWLEVEPRTTQDVNDYVEGKGEFGETSENVVRHLGHYSKIAVLARAIHESK